MTDPGPAHSADLQALIRKHIVSLGITLILLGAVAVVLMSQFRPELDAVTASVFNAVGLSGLIGIIFIADTLIAPFPPDTVLILIAASPHHANWLWLIPLIGLVSSFAGCVGYSLGLYFSRKKWANKWLEPIRVKSQDMVLRYGSWAIVLGALTPVPFSVTVWTAGLLHLPFRHVWKPCLLRVPRYVIYYAVIAYSPLVFN
jgi:membrane protein YqaA with SNARE-associated domain